jgi:hypothetical protein
MKKTVKIMVVLIAFGSLFSGCKKYPEDDKRYWFKSPIDRLSKPGNWDLYAYYVNGADSMSNLMQKYFNVNQYVYLAGKLGFTVTNTHKASVDWEGSIGGGNFALEDTKNKLNITINTLKTGYYNPFINASTNWNIEELTLLSLKIKTTINGNTYEVFFAGGN